MSKTVAGWPHAASPYHGGEMAVQERAGARVTAERVGRQVIRDFMPEQHRAFFGLLTNLVYATLDGRGRPWAGMLAGSTGFLHSPHPRALDIAASPVPGDPAGDGLKAGLPIGLVGIELHTRRRNRMNGRIASIDERGLTVEVGQSFGNCPQYIQARTPMRTATPQTQPQIRAVSAGERIALDIIRNADTCFIASASPGAGSDDPVEGVDVNHRGGRTGFLRVEDAPAGITITLPDFVGNLAFNTLGNILSNPVAGLLVPGFSTGNALSLTGSAEIIWDGPDLENFRGAERLVRITVQDAFLIEGLLPKNWSAAEPAPQLSTTGSWEEAARAISARGTAAMPRSFRVVSVKDESARVRSFELEPEDNQALVPIRPGQFLPLIIDRGNGQPALRAVYSLSRENDGRAYRVSVARSASPQSASHWLHDHIAAGSTLRALSPAGDFTLDQTSQRTVLLIGAGIGITPLLPMMQFLTGGTGSRLRFPERRIFLIHAVRNSADHPFRAEILAKARVAPNLKPIFVYGAPSNDDLTPQAAHVVGRLDRATLQRLLPLDDYDVYLCGPGPFMQAMYIALISLGIADARIHAEAFGPSSLQRQASITSANVAAAPKPWPGAVIHFARSGVTATWGGGTSLLSLAESNGIEAPFGCRSGRCGSCRGPLRPCRPSSGIGCAARAPGADLRGLPDRAQT